MKSQFRLFALSLLCCAVLLGGRVADAMQSEDRSLREFKQNMVATPAELFRALSTLRPKPLSQPSFDARKLEEAGRNFLSKLDPEQQEKAWEFAEKYLRQNGVDSSDSHALMEEFGVPSELQSQLQEQFKQLNDSQNPRDGFSEAQVSKLLQQAKNRSLGRRPEGVNPPNESNTGSNDSTATTGSGADRKAGGNQNRDSTQSGSDGLRPNDAPRNSDDGTKSSAGGGGSDAPGEKNAIKNQNRNNDSQGGSDRDIQDPRSNANPVVPNRDMNRNRQNVNPRTSGRPPRRAFSEDFDPEKLSAELGKIERENGLGGSAGRPTLPDGSIGDNVNWKKVIEDLVEARKKKNASLGQTGSGAPSEIPNLDQADRSRIQNAFKKLTSGDALQPDRFDRARETLTRSIGEKQPDAPENKERLSGRFNRLLVKAAERTLTSDPEKADGGSVPDSLNSALGKLVDRVSESVSSKKGKDNNKRSSQRTRDTLNQSEGADPFDSDPFPERSNSQARDRENGNSNSPNNASSSDGSSSDATSEGPEFSPPKISPEALLDALPDLSNINPKNVFTVFAIIGLALFLGYFVVKGISLPEKESQKSKRYKKMLRDTKIATATDLVEAVDLFLIGKFGSDSKWWNAQHAKRILNSDAPAFSTKINGLIKDYVRARYMRAGLELAETEKARYKQVLEELSNLEVNARGGAVQAESMTPPEVKVNL